jgi:hypothetical protein
LIFNGLFCFWTFQMVFLPQFLPQNSVFECLLKSFETYIDTGFKRN